MSQIIGSTYTNLYGERGSVSDRAGCRWADCSMGRLLTTSMLHACGNCDVALVNAGGIRGSILVGPQQNNRKKEHEENIDSMRSDGHACASAGGRREAQA